VDSREYPLAEVLALADDWARERLLLLVAEAEADDAFGLLTLSQPLPLLLLQSPELSFL